MGRVRLLPPGFKRRFLIASFIGVSLLELMANVLQAATAPARPPNKAALSASQNARLLLGSEALAADAFRPLAGKRVGLLTNPSGLNRQRRSTIELLRNARGVKLVALFAPEHGLNGDFSAGQEFLNSVHAPTGLPIYSLYGPGPVRKPTPAMLQGLDALVYDLQDTGCRSYTFISSMGLAMDACAQAGVEFVVLDRPNPLGGLRVEGPILNPRFRSHVGQWPIPYVYGLTCGELARMINGERWISKPCKLTVVRIRGWRRTMTWRDTSLGWVPTSPKIPHAQSPLYYVATGILGAIGGVNIGFNCNLPFECVLASWLDAARLSDRLNRYRLPGVVFRPLSVRVNQVLLHGVRLEFTDPARAPLMPLNFYLLEAIQNAAKRNLFAEALQANRGFDMFDKVNGTDATRRDLAAGRSAASIVRSWKMGEDSFRKTRAKYLLY